MIEAKLVRNLSGNATIGELVGTAGLGGYGFNAVRRKCPLRARGSHSARDVGAEHVICNPSLRILN